MSTAAISTSSISQQLQSYFQQRGADLQKLGHALQSGDLATAQQEYADIQSLGQSGPFANGDAFKINQRQQDFAAIGQALQSGDLTSAQQAFGKLISTFQHQRSSAPPPSPAVVVNLSGSSSAPATSSDTTASAPAASNGSEIVLNLGNMTAGEQVTIGINQGSNGTEQVTVGVGQQGQSPEQITLNLNQNSNQQIILNLFNGDSSTTQSSGITATA